MKRKYCPLFWLSKLCCCCCCCCQWLAEGSSGLNLFCVCFVCAASPRPAEVHLYKVLPCFAVCLNNHKSCGSQQSLGGPFLPELWNLNEFLGFKELLRRWECEKKRKRKKNWRKIIKENLPIFLLFNPVGLNSRPLRKQFDSLTTQLSLTTKVLVYRIFLQLLLYVLCHIRT